MKHLQLFALLLLSAGCARIHYTVAPDRRNDNLNGNVMVLRERFYDMFRTDGLAEGIFDSTVVRYDRAGNITEQSIALHRQAYRIEREVFVYDDSGRLVGRNALFPGGRLAEMTSYGYNSDGSLAEERIRSGSRTTIRSYAYDRRGFPVRIVQDTMVTLRKYDRRGRLVRTTEIDSGRDSILFRIDCRYRRGILRRVADSNGLVEKYNERGDVAESVNMSVKGRKQRAALTYRIDYEYDELGNWTRRTVGYESEPVSLTLREYEYY